MLAAAAASRLMQPALLLLLQRGQGIHQFHLVCSVGVGVAGVGTVLFTTDFSVIIGETGTKSPNKGLAKTQKIHCFFVSCTHSKNRPSAGLSKFGKMKMQKFQISRFLVAVFC